MAEDNRRSGGVAAEAAPTSHPRRGARAVSGVVTALVALQSLLPLLAFLGGLALIIGQLAESLSPGACNRVVAAVWPLVGAVYFGILSKALGVLLCASVVLAVLGAALQRARLLTAWGGRATCWGLAFQLLMIIAISLALREPPHTLVVRLLTGSEVLGGVSESPTLSDLL